MDFQLYCPSCQNQFDLHQRIPKTLDCKCKNIVCSQCIQQDYKQDQGFKCPRCKNLSVPSVEGLKSNQKLMQSLKNTNVTIKFGDKCSQHSDEEVEFYCFDEEVLYCRKCSNRHESHQSFQLTASDCEGDCLFEQFSAEGKFEDLQKLFCSESSGRKNKKLRNKVKTSQKFLQSRLGQIPKQITQIINQSVVDQTTTFMSSTIHTQQQEFNQQAQDQGFDKVINNFKIQSESQQSFFFYQDLQKYFTIIPGLNQLIVYEIKSNVLSLVNLQIKISPQDDFHATFLPDGQLFVTGGVRARIKLYEEQNTQNEDIMENLSKQNSEENFKEDLQYNSLETIQQFTFLNKAYIINNEGIVKKMKSMNFKRACHQSVFYNDFIYVISGIVNYKKVIPQCEKYNIKKNQ